MISERVCWVILKKYVDPTNYYQSFYHKLFVQEDLKQIDKKYTNECLHEHIRSNYHSGWKGVQGN